MEPRLMRDNLFEELGYCMLEHKRNMKFVEIG